MFPRYAKVHHPAYGLAEFSIKSPDGQYATIRIPSETSKVGYYVRTVAVSSLKAA